MRIVADSYGGSDRSLYFTESGALRPRTGLFKKWRPVPVFFVDSRLPAHQTPCRQMRTVARLERNIVNLQRQNIGTRGKLQFG
ncbi:hypothetical protein EBZ80_09100 [bacterium]|nr:hypothetical protein [bacterium]